MSKLAQTLCVSILAVTAGITAQQLLTQEGPSSLYSSNFKDSKGGNYSTKAHKGSIILLNFWATWCPPCREEIPDFIRLHQEFKDQDFTIIGLAIDKAEKVRVFEQEMGINYPSLIIEKEGYSLMEEYGSTHGALPYSVILNKDGEIAYKHNKGILRYEEAKSLIEPLL